jgi:hypothetical protein
MERSDPMARISLIDRERLPREFVALAETGETAPPFLKSVFYQALAHCPEMYKEFFTFYNTWHEGGVVPPVIKELARLKIARLNDCFT